MRGHQEALAWVAPSDQCLDPNRPAGGQVDLRLIVEDELVTGDSVAQLTEECQATCGLIVRIGDEHGETGSGLPGLVHRHVGSTNEVGDGPAVLRKEGDPNA